MSKPRTPVFVHSLFRSGSTYIFNCFRRVENHEYTAFQEPLNEAVYFYRHDPKELRRIGANPADVASLRHPALARPYYAELCDLWPNWSDFAREDIPFARAFDTMPSDETLGLLRSIIHDAPARPVIQECRSTFRALMIKEAFGGVTIHLWRNPWDQWWSYKSTWYFDVAHELFLMAEPRPMVLDRLRERIGFQAPPAGTLREQIAFLSRHRPTAEASYLTFYTLWLLSQISMHPVQDIEINIDQLAQNPAYRAATLEGLAELGVTGLDFSDCDTPIAWFGPRDAAFFLPLEEEVHSWMLRAGYDRVLLASLFEKRRKFQPLRPEPGDAVIARDIERARALVRELEDRAPQLVCEAEAAQAHQLNALQAAIAQHTNMIAAASAERDGLAAQVGSVTAERDAALAAVSALTAERDALATAIAAMTSERDALMGMISAVCADRSSLNDSVAAIMAERDALSIAVSGLTAERDALAAKEANLQASIAAHEAAARDMAAHKAEQDAVIATLTASNRELSNRLELMAREHEVKLAEARLEKSRAEAEAARLAEELADSDESLRFLQDHLVSVEGLAESLHQLKRDIVDELQPRMLAERSAREEQLYQRLATAEEDATQLRLKLQTAEATQKQLLDESHSRIASILDALNQQSELLAAEQRRRDDLVAINSALESKILAERNEVQRLHEILAEANEWGQASIRHVHLLNVEIEKLRSSTSWRITTPLRMAANTAKRGARLGRRALAKAKRLLLSGPLQAGTGAPSGSVDANSISVGRAVLTEPIAPSSINDDSEPSPDVSVILDQGTTKATACSKQTTERLNGTEAALIRATNGWFFGARVDA